MDLQFLLSHVIAVCYGVFRELQRSYKGLESRHSRQRLATSKSAHASSSVGKAFQRKDAGSSSAASPRKTFLILLFDKEAVSRCSLFALLTLWVMSDRAFLFLFSLAMVIAALTIAGWLIATGQAGTVDGLFLFCACSVNAAAFGLYLRSLIRSAVPEARTHQAPRIAERLDRRSTINDKTTVALPNVR